MRIELTESEELSATQNVLLDNHSLLNLFNVLERQLEQLIREVKEPRLKPYSQFCVDILYQLSEPNLIERLGDIENRFLELADLIKALVPDHSSHYEALEGVLETIEVATSRLSEFRIDRFVWQQIDCQKVFDSLTQFLAATERVSRGRFHFVYAPEPTPESGYRIDFTLKTAGDTLLAPPVLLDSLRDLVANARKYSDPGTCITVVLEEESEGQLRLKVSDEGMGIPEKEIPRVVEYGFRASNMLDRKTMGGGYGLTKAYQLCRKFNGRFFVESEINQGTTIEFSLRSPDGDA
jgi:signal transduction histidine kinase